mmetsp:Transcript_27758/g.43323  ORF Transcript_27758/g.43323 Transcript_27758/m.43323 type:complete len:171 (+) Transcript_27758:1000-1512(+)
MHTHTEIALSVCTGHTLTPRLNCNISSSRCISSCLNAISDLVRSGVTFPVPKMGTWHHAIHSAVLLMQHGDEHICQAAASLLGSFSFSSDPDRGLAIPVAAPRALQTRCGPRGFSTAEVIHILFHYNRKTGQIRLTDAAGDGTVDLSAHCHGADYRGFVCANFISERLCC